MADEKDSKKGKKSKIAEDDPLGSFLSDAASEEAADTGLAVEDDGTVSAQALIDAINAGDAAGVRDAFSAMSLSMKPPGEDDFEMSPDDASGESLDEMV